MSLRTESIEAEKDFSWLDVLAFYCFFLFHFPRISLSLSPEPCVLCDFMLEVYHFSYGGEISLLWEKLTNLGTPEMRSKPKN